MKLPSSWYSIVEMPGTDIELARVAGKLGTAAGDRDGLGAIEADALGSAENVYKPPLLRKSAM